MTVKACQKSCIFHGCSRLNDHNEVAVRFADSLDDFALPVIRSRFYPSPWPLIGAETSAQYNLIQRTVQPDRHFERC
jgi:hypothetical protein